MANKLTHEQKERLRELTKKLARTDIDKIDVRKQILKDIVIHVSKSLNQDPRDITSKKIAPPYIKDDASRMFWMDKAKSEFDNTDDAWEDIGWLIPKEERDTTFRQFFNKDESTINYKDSFTRKSFRPFNPDTTEIYYDANKRSLVLRDWLTFRTQEVEGITRIIGSQLFQRRENNFDAMTRGTNIHKEVSDWLDKGVNPTMEAAQRIVYHIQNELPKTRYRLQTEVPVSDYARYASAVDIVATDMYTGRSVLIDIKTGISTSKSTDFYAATQLSVYKRWLPNLKIDDIYKLTPDGFQELNTVPDNVINTLLYGEPKRLKAELPKLRQWKSNGMFQDYTRKKWKGKETPFVVVDTETSFDQVIAVNAKLVVFPEDGSKPAVLKDYIKYYKFKTPTGSNFDPKTFPVHGLDNITLERLNRKTKAVSTYFDNNARKELLEFSKGYALLGANITGFDIPIAYQNRPAGIVRSRKLEIDRDVDINQIPYEPPQDYGVDMPKEGEYNRVFDITLENQKLFGKLSKVSKLESLLIRATGKDFKEWGIDAHNVENDVDAGILTAWSWSKGEGAGGIAIQRYFQEITTKFLQGKYYSKEEDSYVRDYNGLSKDSIELLKLMDKLEPDERRTLASGAKEILVSDEGELVKPQFDWWDYGNQTMANGKQNISQMTQEAYQKKIDFLNESINDLRAQIQAGQAKVEGYGRREALPLYYAKLERPDIATRYDEVKESIRVPPSYSGNVERYMSNALFDTLHKSMNRLSAQGATSDQLHDITRNLFAKIANPSYGSNIGDDAKQASEMAQALRLASPDATIRNREVNKWLKQNTPQAGTSVNEKAKWAEWSSLTKLTEDAFKVGITSPQLDEIGEILGQTWDNKDLSKLDNIDYKNVAGIREEIREKRYETEKYRDMNTVSKLDRQAKQYNIHTPDAEVVDFAKRLYEATGDLNAFSGVVGKNTELLKDSIAAAQHAKTMASETEHEGRKAAYAIGNFAGIGQHVVGDYAYSIANKNYGANVAAAYEGAMGRVGAGASDLLGPLGLPFNRVTTSVGESMQSAFYSGPAQEQALMQGRARQIQHGASGVLGTGAQGAMIGAALGPGGAALGAIGGGIIGAVSSVWPIATEEQNIKMNQEAAQVQAWGTGAASKLNLWSSIFDVGKAWLTQSIQLATIPLNFFANSLKKLGGLVAGAAQSFAAFIKGSVFANPLLGVGGNTYEQYQETELIDLAMGYNPGTVYNQAIDLKREAKDIMSAGIYSEQHVVAAAVGGFIEDVIDLDPNNKQDAIDRYLDFVAKTDTMDEEQQRMIMRLGDPGVVALQLREKALRNKRPDQSVREWLDEFSKGGSYRSIWTPIKVGLESVIDEIRIKLDGLKNSVINSLGTTLGQGAKGKFDTLNEAIKNMFDNGTPDDPSDDPTTVWGALENLFKGLMEGGFFTGLDVQIAAAIAGFKKIFDYIVDRAKEVAPDVASKLNDISGIITDTISTIIAAGMNLGVGNMITSLANSFKIEARLDPKTKSVTLNIATLDPKTWGEGMKAAYNAAVSRGAIGKREVTRIKRDPKTGDPIEKTADNGKSLTNRRGGNNRLPVYEQETVTEYGLFADSSTWTGKQLKGMEEKGLTKFNPENNSLQFLIPTNSSLTQEQLVPVYDFVARYLMLNKQDTIREAIHSYAGDITKPEQKKIIDDTETGLGWGVIRQQQNLRGLPGLLATTGSTYNPETKKFESKGPVKFSDMAAMAGFTDEQVSELGNTLATAIANAVKAGSDKVAEVVLTIINKTGTSMAFSGDARIVPLTGGGTKATTGNGVKTSQATKPNEQLGPHPSASDYSVPFGNPA